IALQRLGKRAKAVCPEEIPHRFDYLFKAVEQPEFEYKNVVCVDIADTKLLAEMKKVGDTAELAIDHHSSHKDYAKREFVEPESAACCELIYAVIKELGVAIDKDIASCLYTGIATDTGCFKFSNVTPRTHNIAAEMIANGADFSAINYAMFVVKTQGRIKLEQETLKNMHFFADGKIAVITASLALIDSIPDIDTDDIGALANLPREIAGVEIGICVKEKKAGVFKASLRTSDNFDAAEIARHFGGGGHARAAGCSFNGTTMEKAVESIVKASVEAVEKLV
ncbi:MAG: bifunctional oligoribonuclease/PAP phosphatase NrnA, partial [Oscillospiraceae bacterium]